MESEDQRKVWDDIAEDWNKFKRTSDPKVVEFVSKAKGNLLDLGCGSGRNFSKTAAKIYGIDFSKEMIKYAEIKARDLGVRYDVLVGNTINLPYEINFFDDAIAIAVLHCIEGSANRKKSIEELYRVLKVGSRVLIKVWNKDHKRFLKKPKEKYVKWLDKGARYYYFYSEDELLKDLKDAGFKIISSSSRSGERTNDEIIVLAEK